MIKMSKWEWEQRLFFILLALHCVPVLLFTPFVTLDGPAHLYNSHLMYQLWFGNSSVVSSFFEFNSFPEPNWSGHLLLVILQLFLPVLWAEKAILLLIILLSAVGYRKLILQLNPTSGYLSWMVFPFLFNFIFLLGFYNFALALAMLPWWISWWLKFHHGGLNFKNGIVVAFIFMLFYFSHLVVFLLAGLSAGIISLFHTPKGNSKKIYKQLLYLLVVSLPGLFLSFLFVFIFGTEGYRGEVSYLPFAQLVDDIFCSRMFIVYDYTTEKRISFAFSILMVVLTAVSFQKFNRSTIQRTFGWICLSALALIFLIPDSLASGGILSVRLVQWFYMTWCIWLVTFTQSAKMKIAVAVISVGFSFGMMKLHWNVQQELSADAKNYLMASEKVSANSVLLPLNYSSNWMHSNMSCYIGALKNCVVLDNYEATQHHFPIVWKKNMDPEIHMGNHVSSNLPCVHIQTSETKTGLRVNYVNIWQQPMNLEDSCSRDVQKQLLELGYKPTFRNENIQLLMR